MAEEAIITVLVPSDKCALSKELRGTLKKQCPGNEITFRTSPDNDCHVLVGGVCPVDTWWPINRLVLEVERRHQLSAI